MPISQIRFGHPSADTSEAQDVHVLRGQKTQVLRERIWVHDATKNEWRSLSDYETENHDVEFEFAPVFKAAPDGTGKKLQGFGISVDIKNGQVEAKAAPPGHAPSNFILEVFVTENGTGMAAPLIPNGILRVHVHNSVKNVWLTPGKLSIRRSRTAGNEELTDSVFTVRAQFDDDTVGVVTDSDEVKFSPSEWFIAKWVRIPASAGNTVAPFTVKVTTSAKWNNKTADATVEIVQRWQDEPNVPTAELVDGHPDVWSGTRKPEEVPNVLFLGAGFTDADRESFAAITNLVVHNMKRETLLQPFGYLATSINYWRLMLPNTERGISVQCEVQQAMQNGLLFAWALPSPAEAPPTAADWDLRHLIYMAGLPVPADFNLVRDADTHQPFPDLDTLRAHAYDKIDISALQAKWIDTMRLDNSVPMVQSILRYVVKQWLALCDRTFIDEVDDYPPATIGLPPAASLADNTLLQLHRDRLPFGFRKEERVAFFQRIKATPKNGVTVSLDDSATQAPELGNLWAELRDGFAFDNRDFVAILSNVSYGRANSFIHARLSLFAKQPDMDPFVMPGIPVTRDPARNALKLAMPQVDPLLVDKVVDGDTWRVFTHELAHNFGLADEYAEGSGTYTGTEDDLRGSANLTAVSTVVDPATQKVRFDQIKWNWHRIRKAAVIKLPLSQQLNGLYRAFVRKRTRKPFEPGEAVRLRRRRSRDVIGKDPVISNVEFVVDSIHAENLDNPTDPFNMTVVLKNESIGINIEQFGPGSVIYAPIAASPPLFDPVLHPYLTLVPPAAQRMMDKIGGTMTGVACDVSLFSSNLGASTQTPAGDDPEGKVAEIDLPGVVGVYYGGALQACGILHPTGQCMMRQTHDNSAKFCPVCRYILVDRIDPEQHESIDRDYDADYPF